MLCLVRSRFLRDVGIVGEDRAVVGEPRGFLGLGGEEGERREKEKRD